MKDQDRARFRANILWFNQFFEGIRNIYEMVLDQLPVESFPTASTLSSEVYYFPRKKVSPSIPPYYALLLEGANSALQILTVIDSSLIARHSFFVHEPSIVIVVHSQVSKASWADEFALNVIQNHKLSIKNQEAGVVWGQINSRYSANFFAFQVPLDLFSDTENPQAAVRRHIVDPLLENLTKGFPEYFS